MMSSVGSARSWPPDGVDHDQRPSWERDAHRGENSGEQLTSQVISTLAELFQRGSQRIRADHAGAGLGLAIVNSIVQAHDATPP